jgi:hypothetical protein
MGRNEGATIAIALAVGLACGAAPALVPLVLAVGVATLQPRDNTRALAVLGAIVVAGLVGGPAWVIAGALIWRVGTELAARAGTSPMHLASAPVAALLYRLDAPEIVLLCAASVAMVACADWAIARLADWRLNKPFVRDDLLGAQVVLLLPLLALPTSGAALAAFVAMAFMRDARERTPLRYAAA